MTAGLPGSGIGLLLYLILIVLMPLRELSGRNAGRPDGWRAIARQFAVITGMIAVVWLESEAALRLGFASAGNGIREIPFLVLGAVFAAVQVLRWAVARKGPAPDAPQPVP